jgi:hypothetical protein
MFFVNLFDMLLTYHKDLKNATNKVYDTGWVLGSTPGVSLSYFMSRKM